ncbi:hypothetical protein MBLNU459_g7615t1 [Dothideomycetes sp. NU459]
MVKQKRARWVLHLQAQMWRFLMSIGMLLHRLAPPRPPKPSFTRTIPSTVSATAGSFTLYFYVPKDYEHHRRAGFHDKRKRPGRPLAGYPVVINFHGGGFTLGTSTDDARWCGTVVEQCDAVVVSVGYRRAPECPFPTAVEDGVDAVIWVADHADELGIDPDKIALSGFSSGANMAFTVPLRLFDHQTEFSRTDTSDDDDASFWRAGSSTTGLADDASSWQGGGSSTTNLVGPDARRIQLGVLRDEAGASSLSVNRIARSRSAQILPTMRAHAAAKMAHVKLNAAAKNVSLCAICPWYPSTDYTQTRAQRRSTCVRKDQELPSLFTDLFDESYLHPPDTIPLDSPYLSPGIAPTSLLREALPQDIIMHTCEWDMLLDEGYKFYQRLVGDDIGKRVWYKMVEGVPHGWDKAPNPLKPTPGVKEHYLAACAELNRVFYTGSDGIVMAQGSGRRESRLVR